MSRQIQIITELELASEGLLEKNESSFVADKIIMTVQELKLKPVLGNSLYDIVVNQIYSATTSGTTIPSDLVTLIDGYIKPYLKNAAMYDFIVINNYQVTVAGTLKMLPNAGNVIASNELSSAKTYYETLAAQYLQDLIDYLNGHGYTAGIPFTGTTTVWFFGPGFSAGTTYNPTLTSPETDPVWTLEKVDYYKSLQVDALLLGKASTGHTHPASAITQDASNRFVSDTEKTTWNAKQAALVSGTNIKTINGVSILGSGNTSTLQDLSGYVPYSGLPSEIIYLTGVTSSIQPQINARISSVAIAFQNGFASTGSTFTGADPRIQTITMGTTVSGMVKGNAAALLSAVAGMDYVSPTGTETLSNKTLTSPIINAPRLNTSATAGQVWTATGTTGGGNWSTPSAAGLGMLTGGTFANNNFVLTNNTGGTVSIFINNFSGLTVNGIISATTISGGTLYGNGANITGLQDTRITGTSFSNNNLVLTNSTGGTLTTFINNLSGLTVSGSLNAATISATSVTGLNVYGNGSNLTGIPDTKFTGATFVNNVLVLTNNTGGTISVLINNLSGLSSTGLVSAASISATSISGLTLYGNGANITGLQDTRLTAASFSNNTLLLTNSTGGTLTVFINNFSGLSVTGAVNASSVSATSLTGLNVYGNGSNLTGIPDTKITGSSFTNNNLVLTNNTGGTVTTYINNLSGLTVNGSVSASSLSATSVTALNVFGNGSNLTGIPDTKITGATFNNNNNNLVLTNNTGGTVSALVNNLSGLTVNGTLYSTTISAATYQNVFPSQISNGGKYLSTDGTSTSWTALPFSGTVSQVGIIGSTSNASGATISGGTLRLQPASASYGGIVTTTDQTFTGDKTFNAGIGEFKVITNTYSPYGLFYVSESNGSCVIGDVDGTHGNQRIAVGDQNGSIDYTGQHSFFGSLYVDCTTIFANELVFAGSAGSTGQYLKSNGAGAVPSWATLPTVGLGMLTGATFNNNLLSLKNNTGGTVSTLINSFTGLTISGALKSTSLSATTISGGTLYGNGANLTGLPIPTLQQVTTAGDSTSSDIYVASMYLFDSPAGDYGQVRWNDGILELIKAGGAAGLVFDTINLTTGRNFIFPDADGGIVTSVNGNGPDGYGDVTLTVPASSGGYGAIQFADGSGNFAADSRLTWDDTNGYLVNKGYYLLDYPLNSGAGFVGRTNSSSQFTHQIGFNNQGQYGGTLNTISGRMWFLYDFQASAGKEYKMGVNHIGEVYFGHSNTNYSVKVSPPSATTTPLTVKGATSQSANLFEVINVSNAKVFSIGSGGTVGIGVTGTTIDMLEVSGSVRFSGVLKPNNNAGTSGQVLTSNGTGSTPTWTTLGSTGASLVGTIGGSPNASGATIVGSTLTLQPASTSYGGLVTISNQSFAGIKTFTNVLQVDYGSPEISLLVSGTEKAKISAGSAYLQFNATNTGGFIFRLSGGTNAMEMTQLGAMVMNSYGTGTKTGTATYGLAVTSAGNVVEVALGGGGSGTTLSLGTIGSTSNASGATISGGTLRLQPASTSYGGIVTTGSQTFGGNKIFNDSVSFNEVVNCYNFVNLASEVALNGNVGNSGEVMTSQGSGTPPIWQKSFKTLQVIMSDANFDAILLETTDFAGSTVVNYISAGVYEIYNAEAPFSGLVYSPQDKTSGNFIDKDNCTSYGLFVYKVDNATIRVEVRNDSCDNSDGLLHEKFIEIRVYTVAS